VSAGAVCRAETASARPGSTLAGPGTASPPLALPARCSENPIGRRSRHHQPGCTRDRFVGIDQFS
jgi:hypothetical protein